MPTAQEITIQQRLSQEPKPMSIQLSNALAIASNALGAGNLSDETLPSGARVGLETRMRELTKALEFSHPDRVRSIIAGLGTMPSRTEDDPAKQAFIVEQYVAICSDVPPWALEWAAWTFLKNEGASNFRPTGGELREMAMRKVVGVRAERDRLFTVLQAKIAAPSKPISAERRKELAASLIKAGAEMAVRGIEAERARGIKLEANETPESIADCRDARGVVDPVERGAIIVHHEAKLERLKAAASSPLTVSDELRNSNAIRNMALASVREGS